MMEPIRCRECEQALAILDPSAGGDYVIERDWHVDWEGSEVVTGHGVRVGDRVILPEQKQVYRRNWARYDRPRRAGWKPERHRERWRLPGEPLESYRHASPGDIMVCRCGEPNTLPRIDPVPQTT